MSIPRCRMAYGAGIGRNRLVLVRVERGGSSTTLWQDAPDAARLKSITAEIAAALASGRASLAAALPATESFARWLETPLTARDKALKVLPSLLDVQLPFPLETCLYDFSSLQPDATGRYRALACAARRNAIEERIEQHRALGLDPVVLQHKGLALWQQAQTEIPLAPNALRVVAYVGDGRTALTIGSGNAGGELISLHGIRLGADELATPDSPAVRQWSGRVVQILRGLPATAPAEPIQWLWCGPGAERAAMLETALAVRERLRCKTLTDPATFLARALANTVLAGSPAGNLRTGDLTHATVLAHNARKLRQNVLGLLLAGLALIGIGLGWQIWLQHREDIVQAELQKLACRLKGASSIPLGQEVDQVQKALKQQAANSNRFLTPFSHPSRAIWWRYLPLHAPAASRSIPSRTAASP